MLLWVTNLSAFGGILMTRYPEQLTKRLPAWVRHADYVPFSCRALLSRAAALVSRAGGWA